DVLLKLALLDAEQRWLRNVNMATLDQLRHMPEEERQQQRADVRSVNVGVGHQDQLAVAQLGWIEVVLADPATESRNHGANFFVPQHLVVASLLDVEDLTLQRKNRLELPVASLLRRSACRFTLNQVQLTTIGLPF